MTYQTCVKPVQALPHIITRQKTTGRTSARVSPHRACTLKGLMTLLRAMSKLRAAKACALVEKSDGALVERKMSWTGGALI